MRNLRLDLCYDGTRYRGWQRLPGSGTTIQEKLEDALTRILGEPITISGSGRTDAGAHAAHQIANFHTNSTLPADRILTELRRYLPEDIGIYSCRQTEERFHARLSAKSKTYCYRIWNSNAPCVFERRWVHPIPQELDVDAMSRAAQDFLGEHDFSAFCARIGKNKSTIRRIDAISVHRVGDEVRITVSGNGFLYNMVRIMAGTLVEIGLHGRPEDSIRSLFGCRRQDAGTLLPPCGLCLMEVTY